VRGASCVFLFVCFELFLIDTLSKMHSIHYLYPTHAPH
jgi:hypothetical protein